MVKQKFVIHITIGRVLELDGVDSLERVLIDDEKLEIDGNLAVIEKIGLLIRKALEMGFSFL